MERADIVNRNSKRRKNLKIGIDNNLVQNTIPTYRLSERRTGYFLADADAEEAISAIVSLLSYYQQGSA
jgi:Arc/MetJ family transcription regulator